MSEKASEAWGEPAIGRYQILETVAIRGQSTVFKAHDPDLQRLVSLKLYHAQATTGAASVQQVIAEARALVRIDSPFVAKCFNVETIQETPILVNEWIEGESLDAFMGGHSLTYRQVQTLFMQIAAGVEAIHEQGLLHRDIKPSNILINAEMRPRIIDLGLVHREAACPTDSAGTPGYISPEVPTQRETKTARTTDVFGLGAVLYFMLTGRPPFEGATKSEVLQLARECAIVPPHELSGTAPNRLDRVCAKCLQEDPASRYQSVSELLASLHSSRPKVLVGLACTVAVVGLGWLAVGLASGAGVHAANSKTEQAGDAPPEAVVDPVMQAVSDGEFALAIELQRARIAVLPEGVVDQSLRAEFTMLADLGLQGADLRAVKEACDARVAFEVSIDPQSIQTADARVERDQSLLFDRLSRSQLEELASAKQLVFDPRMRRMSDDAEVARRECDAAWINMCRILGPAHLETLRCRSRYAVCLLACDSRSEALAVFDEVERGLVKLLGSESLDLAELWMKRIEVLLVVSGRPDLALLDCERAMAVNRRALGASAVKMLQLRAKRSECLIVERRFELAVLELDGLLVDLEQLPTPEPVGELWVLMLRVSARMGQNQLDLARADLKRMDRCFDHCIAGRGLPTPMEAMVARLRSRWSALHDDWPDAAAEVQLWIECLQRGSGAAEGLILAESLAALYHARAGAGQSAAASAMVAQQRADTLATVHDAEIQCNLAEVQWRAGRVERAREHLDRVVARVQPTSLVQCWEVRASLAAFAQCDDRAAELAAKTCRRIELRVDAARDSIAAPIRDRVLACFRP